MLNYGESYGESIFAGFGIPGLARALQWAAKVLAEAAHAG